MFDTAIINLYRPGDGITPHVDLLRFEVRGIAHCACARARVCCCC